MSQFYSTCSSGEDPDLVLQQCLEQLSLAPVDTNFGFIYVSDAIAESLANILQQCKLQTGIQHWVGSVGVGIIATNREIYDMPAISIMLCQFPEEYFSKIATVTNREELFEKLHLPSDSASCFAFVHADPYNAQSQDILHDIGKATENCFLSGGFTSSRTLQYQITDDVVSGGVSGVIFSDKIPVLTNLSQGCSPLGKKHLITKSQDNIAIELDNHPALSVLYNDIGETLSRDIEQAANYIFAGLCVPNSDNSDYTIRNLVGIDENEGVFAINDNLIEGQEIIICRRDGNTANDDMQAMLEKLKKRLSSPPKGGVYISCLGRGREQFGDDSEEIKMIHQTLGEFPLTGFFANGEIHHNRVYGYTGVLTLFT